MGRAERGAAALVLVGAALRLVVAAASAEERRRAPLDPRQRFEQTTTDDAEAKARIAGDVDRLFATVRHVLVCRNSVCRVELLVRQGERLAWPEALHDDALLRKTGAAMVQGGPDADGRYVAWLPVYTTASPSGGELLDRVVEHYRASAEKRACARLRDGVHGELVVSLALAPAHGISARVGGTLRDTPYGRCVAGAVTQAISAVHVPAGADGATRSWSERF